MQNPNKIFDPNSIDEDVIDFYLDTVKAKMFVTLKCGQIFVFTQKKNNFYGNFKLSLWQQFIYECCIFSVSNAIHVIVSYMLFLKIYYSGKFSWFVGICYF